MFKKKKIKVGYPKVKLDLDSIWMNLKTEKRQKKYFLLQPKISGHTVRDKWPKHNPTQQDITPIIQKILCRFWVC